MTLIFRAVFSSEKLSGSYSGSLLPNLPSIKSPPEWYTGCNP